MTTYIVRWRGARGKHSRTFKTFEEAEKFSVETGFSHVYTKCSCGHQMNPVEALIGCGHCARAAHKEVAG